MLCSFFAYHLIIMTLHEVRDTINFTILFIIYTVSVYIRDAVAAWSVTMP